MRRWGKWLVGAMLMGLVVLSVPILWIEVGCRTPRDPAARKRPPLVSDSGYARRESDSYLTYPEWHIVYAYDDFAAVLRNGDPSGFAYFGQISEFWSSLLRAEPPGDHAEERRAGHQGHALHHRLELHGRAGHQGRLRKDDGALLRMVPGPRQDGGGPLRHPRHAGLRGIPPADPVVRVPLRLADGRPLAGDAATRQPDAEEARAPGRAHLRVRRQGDLCGPDRIRVGDGAGPRRPDHPDGRGRARRQRCHPGLRHHDRAPPRRGADPDPDAAVSGLHRHRGEAGAPGAGHRGDRRQPSDPRHGPGRRRFAADPARDDRAVRDAGPVQAGIPAGRPGYPGGAPGRGHPHTGKSEESPSNTSTTTEGLRPHVGL